ncbi:hypothetical protein DFR76_103481 [Nocardia pseudobrasiliensis]|uniref:Uncharacterized protein n=1 Tax=Nocardia pseudobrasiliensis TaxID=45979 RepID=A0A370I9V4_9NOCA|nr:hypothetical protein DFR76_103481 [Nocardia pseudobrasiliensis]
MPSFAIRGTTAPPTNFTDQASESPEQYLEWNRSEPAQPEPGRGGPDSVFDRAATQFMEFVLATLDWTIDGDAVRGDALTTPPGARLAPTHFRDRLRSRYPLRHQ